MVVRRRPEKPMTPDNLVKLLQMTGAALAIPAAAAGTFAAYQSYFSTEVTCRYCCKSLFALVITIPPGCRRDFRVKMWGTSSPDDKLTGDLGNVIETTQIGGRRSDRLTAGNLSPGNFGLLQHNLP